MRIETPKGYLAFDLEIASVLPEGTRDLLSHRPLGISCAATADDTGATSIYEGRPKMTQSQAIELLSDLSFCQHEDTPIVTWNGAAFDLLVLGEEANDMKAAAKLAKNHVDLMVVFLAVKGYRMGLKTAAMACGSIKGTAEMESGAAAPEMWAAGQYDTVLAYVEQDAVATAEILEYLLNNRGFSWISKKGYTNLFKLPGHVKTIYDLTVEKVLTWREPDTSWMSDPPKRSDILAWTLPYAK